VRGLDATLLMQLINIPSISCRLGIASLRRLAIVRSSNSLSLSTVPSTATQAFGQSECLTSRLRSIIGDYAESSSILLEVSYVSELG
jgi:sacsin